MLPDKIPLKLTLEIMYITWAYSWNLLTSLIFNSWPASGQDFKVPLVTSLNSLYHCGASSEIQAVWNSQNVHLVYILKFLITFVLHFLLFSGKIIQECETYNSMLEVKYSTNNRWCSWTCIRELAQLVVYFKHWSRLNSWKKETGFFLKRENKAIMA